MELEEFVKRTILDITNGVYEARKEAHLAIAPGYVEGASITEPQMIEFEVAVAASSEGGGQISIWQVANAGAKASSETENRIRFSVPVYFQAMNAQKDGS